MRLLIQADIDGEIAPADAARVGAHLEICPACAQAQMQLLALTNEMRQEVPYHNASAALHLAVRGRIAANSTHAGATALGQANPASRQRGWWHPRHDRSGAVGRRWAPAGFFGSGFALAAGLALIFLLPGANAMPDLIVSDHIRALQPGHLIDIASTDQHTVKPWFDGKLDFAPPVKDFAVRGFPLTGGRLDYLAGHPVAAMIYQHGQHIIDLYAWPTGSSHNGGPSDGSRSGYNFVHWEQDGMTLWAVSDLNAQELTDFVRVWQQG